MIRAHQPLSQTWRTILLYDVGAIVVIDFLDVATVNFRLLALGLQALFPAMEKCVSPMPALPIRRRLKRWLINSRWAGPLCVAMSWNMRMYGRMPAVGW